MNAVEILPVEDNPHDLVFLDPKLPNRQLDSFVKTIADLGFYWMAINRAGP